MLGLAMLVVTLVAACGGSTKPASVASPSPTGGAGTAATPGPEATSWPLDVVEAVVALGAADTELWKAGADIARAADSEDVKAMWGAADGTVKLIQGLT